MDISADYWVLPHVRLLGGVSNLIERKYFPCALFSRSLEPTSGRNYYLDISAVL